MDTRLVRLGEEPKPWRRPESLAGLFTPAMAWLLALVDLAAAAVGELVLPPLMVVSAV